VSILDTSNVNKVEYQRLILAVLPESKANDPNAENLTEYHTCQYKEDVDQMEDRFENC
jgi:hypothetical protein